MRLLDRYLLREFLAPLGFCLSGFLLLAVAADLTGELRSMQAKRLLAHDIVQYYAYRLPDFAVQILPMALLLALLYTLTNHARHNELTAIRGAGISLWRLSVPFLAIGALSSVASFAVNEFVAPAAENKAEIILRRRIERITPQNRHLVRPLDFINMSIGGGGRKWHASVYDTRTFAMSDVKVQSPLTNGARVWLNADRGNWTNDMWVFSGKVSEFVEGGGQLRPTLQTNLLAKPEFLETPEMIQSEIVINEKYHNPTRTHRADISLRELVSYLGLHPRPQPPGLRSWVYTKLHGRFAVPCTCLIMVIVAIPFGAATGRRNVFVGVAASISLYFAYFLLQQLGFAFGATGQLPPVVGAWLPNLFFGAAGLWMMARVR